LTPPWSALRQSVVEIEKRPPAPPVRRRDVASQRLAIETFVSRATSSSGSPRSSRATIAILRSTSASAWLGGLAVLEQKLYRNFRVFCGIETPHNL
jgi:hypothetical protein